MAIDFRSVVIGLIFSAGITALRKKELILKFSLFGRQITSSFPIDEIPNGNGVIYMTTRQSKQDSNLKPPD